jgi:hypothetical protein
VTDEEDLLRIIIHGATAFELLRSALELDIFERLQAAGGMDLPAIAEQLEIEQQPARILLLGLTSLKLIRKEGNNYVNTGIARRSLLRSRRGFLGQLIDMQAKIVNPAVVDLSESIRHHTNVGLRHLSGPGTTLYERLTAHPELQDTFYASMGDASKKTFPLVLYSFDFSSFHHVLDLGGGDASNSIELARRYEHLEVTVFDQESVIQVAENNIAQAGLADRVHVCSGDFFKDPLPGGIDGILFCHIFEMWSLERNVDLLRRSYAALPTGGAVLVYNFVSDEENTGPLTAAFMSAYFLALASGEGMVYPARDVEMAIRDAGFSQVERSLDGIGFNHALLVGVK